MFVHMVDIIAFICYSPAAYITLVCFLTYVLSYMVLEILSPSKTLLTDMTRELLFIPVYLFQM